MMVEQASLLVVDLCPPQAARPGASEQEAACHLGLLQ